jgi:hypothetical protein
VRLTLTNENSPGSSPGLPTRYRPRECCFQSQAIRCWSEIFLKKPVRSRELEHTSRSLTFQMFQPWKPHALFAFCRNACETFGRCATRLDHNSKCYCAASTQYSQRSRSKGCCSTHIRFSLDWMLRSFRIPLVKVFLPSNFQLNKDDTLTSNSYQHACAVANRTMCLWTGELRKYWSYYYI